MITLILFLLVAFGLVKGRQWLLHKPIISAAVDDMEGELFTFEKTTILRRQCPNLEPSRLDHQSDKKQDSVDQQHPSNLAVPSIICFPGFMETSQYFTELYADRPVELILINNCDYHNPFPDQPKREIPWLDKIPYDYGSIAYDAALVNLAAKHLVSNERIIVHGHSRGGAVMLEAAKQNPLLFSNIDLILESPLLPQARLPRKSEALIQYGGLFPLPAIIHGLNALPYGSQFRNRFSRFSNSRKTELLSIMTENPNDVDIMIRQIESIYHWSSIATYDMYCNARSVMVVMGESDEVLPLGRMERSARYGESVTCNLGIGDVQLVRVENTDHFPSLESPEQMSSIVDQVIALGHRNAKNKKQTPIVD